MNLGLLHAIKSSVRVIFSGLLMHGGMHGVSHAASFSGELPQAKLVSAQTVMQTEGASKNASKVEPRASRHALIIGVGDYLNPSIPQLKGVGYDIDSALKMVHAMQVPLENTRILRDHEATAARIEQEIAELNNRTQLGDRVFFYYSGHGSRWLDTTAPENGCVEALLAADSQTITNQRMAAILKPISDKTDKLFVFYDACHSGGIIDRPMVVTRSLQTATSKLTAKFSPAGVADACAKPANIKTRSFTTVALQSGGLPENIVQISSSRPDEVSFDDEQGGGLATQAWRDCMLGEGKDLDGSGGISVAEIAACAQKRIDARFAGNAQFAAQHFTLGGNKAFVPNWFASAFQSSLSTAAQSSTVASAASDLKPSIATQIHAQVPTEVKTEADPGLALKEIFAQRDPRRSVTLKANSEVLKISKDTLDLTLTSSHDGHVYLILLGSDNHSFYMLFPNDRDNNNLIKAGQSLTLPRPDWQITAQGPAGIDRLLAVVTESPRNLGLLGAVKAGPFLQSLTDQAGRANLQWLLGTSINQMSQDCKPSAHQSRNAQSAKKCSDAFGAAMVDILEQ